MTTFKLDTAGNEELLRQLANGFHDLGNAAADAISLRAPRNTGRYARSIQATTFLEGGIWRGKPVRGTGVQSKAQIWTVIYTNNPIGHLHELGTAERTVVAKGGGYMVWVPDKYSPDGGIAKSVHQPAMQRHPHFWAGLASVIPRAGQIIGNGAKSKGTRVNTKVA